MVHSRERHGLQQGQKMVVLGVAFGVYGFSILIADWLPPLFIGTLELSVEYALFLPLVLCIILHPLYAAGGAAIAELVIGGIVLGHFEGIMMLGRTAGLWGALWVGGVMVRTPHDRKQIGLAAFAAVVIYQTVNSLFNLASLITAGEELSAVPGLVQLLIIMEGFIFFEAVLVSGILYTVLPAMLLGPYVLQISRRRDADKPVGLRILKPAR